MTALEMMKLELNNIYQKQLSCLNSEGYIYLMDQYKRYVEQAEVYKQAIEYLIKEECDDPGIYAGI